MNARSVATILDDLAPRQGFAHDWSDVLERAGVREAGASGPASRRRKWLLLAAVVAAVLVPVAAATVAPTNDWWIFHADHGLHPVTEPVVVQTGTWDGKRWQLVVSRFAGNGIDGYCSSVMPYGSPPAASSGGCGGFIARQVRRRQTDDPGSDDDPSARSGKALRAGLPSRSRRASTTRGRRGRLRRDLLRRDLQQEASCPRPFPPVPRFTPRHNATRRPTAQGPGGNDGGLDRGIEEVDLRDSASERKGEINGG
jgi:hypothetical protein